MCSWQVLKLQGRLVSIVDRPDNGMAARHQATPLFCTARQHAPMRWQTLPTRTSIAKVGGRLANG